MGLFRPCIDIHNGKVKQIVGSTLQDEGDKANDNFVSDKDAAYYAELYKADRLKGGHVIILNPAGSPYFEESRQQAIEAISAYPDGLQVGGSINADNAGFYIEKGARAVIVTSYVFKDGRINMEHLRALRDAVGAEHVVLDLSCRQKDGEYLIVTDRWQKFTDTKLRPMMLEMLSEYVSEFLVHAVDAEGKRAGIDRGVLDILVQYKGKKVTYAGGIHTMEDVDTVLEAGMGRIRFTVGSGLDLYGGNLKYDILKAI